MRSLAVCALAILFAGPVTAQPPAIGSGIFDGDLPFVNAQSTGPTGPIDTRFFGTFCQPEPREFCKSVPVLPDPCVTLRDTRIHLDHLTTATGGLLLGGGSFVLDGKSGQVALAGAVIKPGGLLGVLLPNGGARLVARAPGLGERRGLATLSADGLQLRAALDDRAVVLRKDACGNNPPQVSLTATGGPTFPYSSSVQLVGHIVDEDTTFPEERLVFRSDRQGLLSGNRFAGGRTLSLTSLVPGTHRITLTVTDSGGLSAAGSTEVTIVNRPPEAPIIFLPTAGATLVAEAPVLLSGTALDPDTGFLSGPALRWTAQFDPGGPFLDLGSGNEVGLAFPAPVDPLTIRLTATDSSGQTSMSERQVRVAPNQGNGPPVAAIRLPDRSLVNGSPVAGFFSFQPASFVGTAFDAEDPVADLEIVWEVVAIGALGGPPLAAPPVPNPTPVTGTLAPVVTFHPNANGLYRVTLRVTDRGGLTSSDSIEIYTQSSPIL